MKKNYVKLANSQQKGGGKKLKKTERKRNTKFN